VDEGREPVTGLGGRPRIVVAGAGSIGCFVGGGLAAAGQDVRFLARPRMVEELRRCGLSLSDRDGGDWHLAGDGLVVDSNPALLAEAELVLVTVKSGATVEMGATLAAHAPSEAVVVSLQNGVDNVELLRRALPGRRVVAGMVPFNVVHLGEGRFHRGTDGDLLVGAGVPGLRAALAGKGFGVAEHPDMVAIAWGKLLLNLNNALNALSGLPLREQVGRRAWRRVLAACMDEALAALDAAGMTPARVARVRPGLMPTILRLPDPLFRLLAGAMVRIDPTARSSMWEDLEKRRPTEIDQLQGAVVALAERMGRDAPVNRRVRDLVRTAERDQAGSPRLEPGAVMG
jgi:2-dehydropantoate 2-reductase